MSCPVEIPSGSEAVDSPRPGCKEYLGRLIRLNALNIRAKGGAGGLQKTPRKTELVTCFGAQRR
jgi:hypothetical protein